MLQLFVMVVVVGVVVIVIAMLNVLNLSQNRLFALLTFFLLHLKIGLPLS